MLLCAQGSSFTAGQDATETMQVMPQVVGPSVGQFRRCNKTKARPGTSEPGPIPAISSESNSIASRRNSFLNNCEIGNLMPAAAGTDGC
jgi:hypothetical protein